MGIKINNSKKSKTYNNLSKRSGGKKAVKYIVVHYTGSGKAGDSKSASNNCVYFNGANRGASADFFINDYGIWRYNPNCAKWYSWAVGCGSWKNAKAIVKNSESISIEVVSSGAAFTKKETEYLAWLVKKLQKKYGVKKSHVVRHYDCHTGHKECPAPYCGSAAKDKKWTTLRNKIAD